ncbi:MAG: hypothetical protein RR547_10240, partial [Raoultibacter sp.]
MKLRSKDFILVLGTACAWAQTLLDRSGIIPYGGAAATLDQVTIWASIAISAIICTIIVYFLGAKRGIAFLSITGTLFVFAGCTLLLALNQGIGTDTPTVTNLATLMLAAARAPIIQIWTYYLVINKQAPRLMLLSSVLASCLVLFTTSLPSQDMHLTSYLLASLIGSTLTIIPMSTLRNAAGDSQQKGMFSS